MCTLSWWKQETQWGVFFNRDEKKNRPIALPPRLTRTEKSLFLSPLDPQGKGSWIVANSHGWVIAILNRWHEQPISLPAEKSRGKLLLELAEITHPEIINASLKKANLKSYAPFTLVCLNSHDNYAWSWNGKILSHFQPELPLISSSYQYEVVADARKKQYQQLIDKPHHPTLDELSNYHANQDRSTASAKSVRMCRNDAQTWSRSEITFSSKSIIWDYWQEHLNFEEPPILHRYNLSL